MNRYKEIRLQDNKTPRTINFELSCLSRIYKVAKEQGIYSGLNPVSETQLFEIPIGTYRILTFEEEARLMVSYLDYLRDIIVCALNTGMRRGEIVGLKWENVKLDHGYILLEATNTKSKRERKVPINSIMKDMFLRLRNNNSEYVFLNSQSNPFHDGVGIRKSFYTARRKAGIEDFRFHDLRHTAATRMVEANISLFTVGQILGHSDPKTTMRYAHPDQALKEGIEALAHYNHDNHHNSNNTNDANNTSN